MDVIERVIISNALTRFAGFLVITITTMAACKELTSLHADASYF